MTQSARWYMDVVGEVLSGMGARTNEALIRFVEQSGVPVGPEIQFVQLAYGFAPDPITAEHLIKQTPYANPAVYGQRLDDAVEGGWLVPAGEAQYKLADRGREVAERLFALGDQLFNDLRSLPEADLRRIIALLQRVVVKARALPEPRAKWALSLGSRFDRGPSAPLMVQVRRHLLDLLAFRDDVHIAAWLPYGVSGQVWEALTFVWRGEAGTAAGLAEKLPFRNYSEEAYAAALQDLVSRGWIAEQEDRYVATEEGERLRQEAEDATDRFFDAAWASLSVAETKELRGLLEDLAGVLRPSDREQA